MVRPARKVQLLNRDHPSNSHTSILGKRQKNPAVNNVSSNQSNGSVLINENDKSKPSDDRLSKRRRRSYVPYQAPASLSSLILSGTKAKPEKVNKVTKTPSAVLTNRKTKASRKSYNRADTLKSSIKTSVALKNPREVKQTIKKRISKSKPSLKKAAIGQNNVGKHAKQAQKTRLPKDTTASVRKRKSEKVSQGVKRATKTSKDIKTKVLDEKFKKRKSKKGILNPRPHITQYSVDPTYNSTISIPHVSTLAHSRLIIRSVLNNDMKSLKTLISKDSSQICSICIPRSLIIDRDALTYAMQLGNKEAIKILVTTDEKAGEKFGPFPDMTLESESTGSGYQQRMMFGHALRAVTVGRGGKEGNAAFLKDLQMYSKDKTYSPYNQGPLIRSLCAGVPFPILEHYISLNKQTEASRWQIILSHIFQAIRYGHRELAGKLISLSVKRGGFGFNALHEESLNHTNQPYSPFKAVSVVKKSMDNNRLTPIHCAAINPNQEYLQTLLNSRPEYNLQDTGGWTPVHYASVCTGDGPLKLLLSRGISTQLIDKEGNTPLHLAASRGRLHNVKLLLEYETVSSDEDKEPRLNSLSLTRVNKKGLTPLHIAAKKGFVHVARAIIEAGADGNKFTPAQHDKLTPFMVACQYRQLEMVRFLIEQDVKFELGDRKGRTALTHAVINGHADVVSYLLTIGVNAEAVDSSGNTLVHYAAAYGWYFCIKLLLEAGCNPNQGNHWKLTPMALAFMKGHIGIVEMLVKQPGVDIDTAVDDNGKSLLLQTCEATNFKQSLLDRFRFLIEDHKADCKKVDFEGNNALHFLAKHTLTSSGYYGSEHDLHIRIRTKNQVDAAKFLVDRGCDVNGLNIKNQTPLQISIINTNFDFAEQLLNSGVKFNPIQVDDEGDTLLHGIATHVNSKEAIKFCKTISKNADHILAMKSMVNVYNKAGLSPLLKVLQVYTNISEATAPFFFFYVNFLVNKLDADVNAVVKTATGATSDFILHRVVSLKNSEEILEILLKKSPRLDPLDGDLRTPLLLAILKGHETIARALIKSGADVNFKSKNDWSLSLILLLGETQPTLFGLIPLMVSKGANVREVNPKTKNSILHYVARNPDQKQALEALETVLKAGVGNKDVNLPNNQGRTPLHLVVNARGTETDASYDIEDILISAGANVIAKDVRGRIPLHYAFIKIGNPLEASFLDPIELVMILVNSMKEANAARFISTPDIYGATPLHYAARRGATICCSLLMKEMSGNIDVRDFKGNTPFGLAVLNKHEGCSLHFQQQGADFLSILDANIKVEEDPSETEVIRDGKHDSTDEMWVWQKTLSERQEKEVEIQENKKSSILQAVVSNDWQGILYLMLGSLKAGGIGVSAGVSAAIKTQRYKLALKLIHRAKDAQDLGLCSETLCHILAKNADPRNNSDLQVNVLNSLFKKGVNSSQLDSDLTHSIIYAAANHNYPLIAELTYGHDQVRGHSLISNHAPDRLGRTPFSAIFWNLDTNSDFSKELKAWATSLLSKGASVNTLTSYPFHLSTYPGVRFITRSGSNQLSPKCTKYTPLILAVICGNYPVVHWLLNLGSKIDANLPDEEGRTALMHAVRLNDIKMVKLLLNPGSYNFVKDVLPWTSKFSAKNSGNIDMNKEDSLGWMAVDYVNCPNGPTSKFVSKHVEPILEIVFKTGSSFTKKSSKDNISPLERVIKIKSPHVVKAMYKLMKTPQSQQIQISPDYTPLSSIPAVPGLSLEIPNFPLDLKQIIEEKIKESSLDSDETTVKPDPLLQMDPENSIVLTDQVQAIPYDCIMTKVDITYGVYGLYNFYKMQIVKQPRGKELVVLFTQWGRVGDQGQHQKTPFASEEEAIKEFKKIFKSKSGNDWESLCTTGFNPNTKKYRLVSKELGKRVHEISVDFEQLVRSAKDHRSVLSPKVYDLLKQICFAHNNIGSDRNNRYRGRVDFQNTDNLPLVSTDALKQGESLLKEINTLLHKKEKLSTQNVLENNQEEISKIMDDLVELSERFYTLIPVYGFAKEKLQPIFDWDALSERQRTIYNLLHLGFAKELLLAAEKISNLTNPFEYIYRCLGTRIKLLDMKNDMEMEEAQIILQYISNTTNEIEKVKVEGVFRVDRGAFDFDKSTEAIHNRTLLWHGTKAENVLAILHNGLRVAPLEANLSGHLFGKGIYFADMFTKSKGYSHGSGSCKSKFMFLCEVALGNVREIDLQIACTQASEPGGKFLPDGYDSLKTSDSLFEPDPAATIIWKGRTVPLGQKVVRIDPTGEHRRGLHYNEYIVFNESQVKLRYMVQFSDC